MSSASQEPVNRAQAVDRYIKLYTVIAENVPSVKRQERIARLLRHLQGAGRMCAAACVAGAAIVANAMFTGTNLIHSGTLVTFATILENTLALAMAGLYFAGRWISISGPRLAWRGIFLGALNMALFNLSGIAIGTAAGHPYHVLRLMTIRPGGFLATLALVLATAWNLFAYDALKDGVLLRYLHSQVEETVQLLEAAAQEMDQLKKLLEDAPIANGEG